jgi:eukaryotic-like serine/threonine-protein kinase
MHELAHMKLCPIGAGGVGEVYRARDTRFGHDVAIKVLPTSCRTGNPERLKRCEQAATDRQRPRSSP